MYVVLIHEQTSGMFGVIQVVGPFDTSDIANNWRRTHSPDWHTSVMRMFTPGPTKWSDEFETRILAQTYRDRI